MRTTAAFLVFEVAHDANLRSGAFLILRNARMRSHGMIETSTQLSTHFLLS